MYFTVSPSGIHIDASWTSLLIVLFLLLCYYATRLWLAYRKMNPRRNKS